MNWESLLSIEREIAEKSDDITNNMNEFEKDYTRIISSAIFRRLQDKTQSFPLEADDYIRTRLTHSLEVSSIAKVLGMMTFETLKNRKVDPFFESCDAESFRDLLMSASLIHDIGNPPFGHFGENAIRNWFRENLSKITYKGKMLIEYLDEQMVKDFYNFEGNAQALRILSKSSFMGSMNGYNLCYGVLNTIIKYPISSLKVNIVENNKAYKKIGYYYSEQELFKKIVDNTGAKAARHPLTYLLEAADDIAYSLSDIEDAIVKDVISLHDLINNMKEYLLKHQLLEDYRTEFENSITLLKDNYATACKKNVGKPELVTVQKWTTEIRKLLIKNAVDCFVKNYDEIMNGIFQYNIFKGTIGEHIISFINEMTNTYVLSNKAKIKLELGGTKIIHFLLDVFVPAAIYYDTDNNDSILNERIIQLLSKHYKSSYHYYSKNITDDEKLYLRILMVNDFISGMTDSYAKKMYQDLNGL